MSFLAGCCDIEIYSGQLVLFVRSVLYHGADNGIFYEKKN